MLILMRREIFMKGLSEHKKADMNLSSHPPFKDIISNYLIIGISILSQLPCLQSPPQPTCFA